MIIEISESEIQNVLRCFSPNNYPQMPKGWIGSVVVGDRVVSNGVLVPLFGNFDPVASESLKDLESLSRIAGVHPIVAAFLRFWGSPPPKIAEGTTRRMEKLLLKQWPQPTRISEGVTIQPYDKYLPEDLYYKVRDQGEFPWSGYVYYQCVLSSGEVLNCKSSTGKFYYFVDLPNGMCSRDIVDVRFELVKGVATINDPELILVAVTKPA